MDMQKPAATRVRHILQAMERSIDSARSRRTNTPATSGSHTTSGDTSTNARSHGDSVTHPSHSMQSHRMTQPANNAPRPAQPPVQSPLIGGNAAVARTPLTPVDPNQPARLKAKPKRFESTFAAQFAQNPQSEYRSQAG